MSWLEPLRGYLDQHGIGGGELTAEPIGDGHSNLTYLLRRSDEKFVLRRPPRGDLAPSANDVVREARIVAALAGRLPVPKVLSICESEEVIGAPFFVSSYVDGAVLVDRLPRCLDSADAGAEIGRIAIEILGRLHSVDLLATGLESVSRPTGYLERQLRRFGDLLERNATRPLPELETVGEWLVANRPESGASTLVHGDYRLGNLMFARGPRLVAVLDWEMATVGDPLADLGYCTATWAQPGDPPDPMLELSAVTTLPGFPSRDALADLYAELTGRSLDSLPWYEALAVWKAAIFLEGSYARFRAGDSTDPYFARLDQGVPALGRAALTKITS